MLLLQKFPYIKINYDKNKPLQNIDLKPFSNNQFYRKLITIYSIIQDSVELLTNINEDEILEFIKCNDYQKENRIFIKKNIFEFFIQKSNSDKSIKRICKNVGSIPLLFDYLSNLNQEQFKKVKGLMYSDLPNQYSIDDNLIELIQKYEKIKEAFSENEINIVWREYLNLWYNTKEIKDLENVFEAFDSINGKYNLIKNEIKDEIIKIGKNLIKKSKLKSLEMYKFINKYNSSSDLLSDDELLNFIGKNIILEELDSDVTLFY